MGLFRICLLVLHRIHVGIDSDVVAGSFSYTEADSIYWLGIVSTNRNV